MSKNYGFYTGELEIKPFLTKQEVWMDCRDEILKSYRRPGKTSHYIVAKEDVEPYFRSKGLPDHIIEQKLRELKIYTEEEQMEILRNVVSRKFKKTSDQLQLDIASLAIG